MGSEREADFDVDAAQRYFDNEEGAYEMARYHLGQALDVIRRLRTERDEARAALAVEEAELRLIGVVRVGDTWEKS